MRRSGTLMDGEEAEEAEAAEEFHPGDLHLTIPLSFHVRRFYKLDWAQKLSPIRKNTEIFFWPLDASTDVTCAPERRRRNFFLTPKWLQSDVYTAFSCIWGPFFDPQMLKML